MREFLHGFFQNAYRDAEQKIIKNYFVSSTRIYTWDSVSKRVRDLTKTIFFYHRHLLGFLQKFFRRLSSRFLQIYHHVTGLMLSEWNLFIYFKAWLLEVSICEKPLRVNSSSNKSCCFEQIWKSFINFISIMCQAKWVPKFNIRMVLVVSSNLYKSITFT